MENLLARHRNVTILVVVLFAEIVGLAVQVKRTADTDSSRLIRVWTITAVTPLERGFVAVQQGISNAWHNYFYLRGVRAQNRQLQDEIEQLRLQQVRLSEDAGQARRLQRLLGFKEQFIAKTLAAQVIGSSGSDMSRVVYIDKGEGDGVRQDMAVITANGVVGKILRVFPTSSQVLLINDPSSGVGVILEKSRLQGVIKGTPNGQVVLEKMMSDERVEPGDQLLTSGGDQIFPKGLPIGTVKSVSAGNDVFLKIRIKPAAELDQLEEVLVITQVVERQPTAEEAQTSMRAVDILASRLPSVPEHTGMPATGIPLPVGMKPPSAIPNQIKTGKEVKPGTKPVAPGAAQTGIAPKPRPKPSQAQVTGDAARIAPKAVNGALPGAESDPAAPTGSTGTTGTVARKPRPLKPAAGATEAGIVKTKRQAPPVTDAAEPGGGAAGSPAPTPKATAPAKPPTSLEPNSPTSPPAEGPQP